MSIVTTPVLHCDSCRSRIHRGIPGETATSLRADAAKSGWARRGRQDLCPHCSGYYADRYCRACGRAFWGEPSDCCPTCSGDVLPDPPRTLEDAMRDEVKLAVRRP